MSMKEENELELYTVLENRPYREQIGHNGGTKPINVSPKIHTMDDHTLCQLIQEALTNPLKAEALGFSIDLIPEIKRKLRQDLQPYYEEALPYTVRDIQRNINRFSQTYSKLHLEERNCLDPDDARIVREYFVKWVLMILTRDCQDFCRKKRREVSLNKPTGEDSTLEDIIPSTETNQVDDTSENLQKMLEKLPELLPQHPKNCPQATAYELIQRRYFYDPPQTWQEIAQDLNCSSNTIYSHWKNICLPNLKQIAKQFNLD